MPPSVGVPFSQWIIGHANSLGLSQNPTHEGLKSMKGAEGLGLVARLNVAQPAALGGRQTQTSALEVFFFSPLHALHGFM
jgi:hypothetical protein